MKTCPDCGERIYNLGCVWCNEAAYIEEQDRLTDAQEDCDEMPPQRGTVGVIPDAQTRSNGEH